MGRKARCEHIEPAIPRTFQIGSPVLSVADSCTATEDVHAMIYSITSPAREHKRLRDREFERPSGRQIDDKIKLARLLDRISPGFASRSTEPRASDMQALRGLPRRSPAVLPCWRRR
jgi:hypothetical protein